MFDDDEARGVRRDLERISDKITAIMNDQNKEFKELKREFEKFSSEIYFGVSSIMTKMLWFSILTIACIIAILGTLRHWF